jgi:hypothetical protein
MTTAAESLFFSFKVYYLASMNLQYQRVFANPYNRDLLAAAKTTECECRVLQCNTENDDHKSRTTDYSTHARKGGLFNHSHCHTADFCNLPTDACVNSPC